jgi:hypothetical protein
MFCLHSSYLGLKLSCRNLNDKSDVDCFESEKSGITESQIAEFGVLSDICEKKRRKSYGYVSDSNSDTGPVSGSSQCKMNYSNVSHSMGSRYNESSLSLSSCAHFSLEDDSDKREESLTVLDRMREESYGREASSSCCNFSVGKCDRSMMECQQQTARQVSQRCMRLQNVPPWPLFSRVKPDPSIPADRKEEQIQPAAVKKSICPIQSKICNLISLCKSNILGSGSGPPARITSSPSTHTHTHSSNGELLSISDEEMLNFPRLFTDAFNIGDYDGVSKVMLTLLLVCRMLCLATVFMNKLSSRFFASSRSPVSLPHSLSLTLSLPPSLSVSLSLSPTHTLSLSLPLSLSVLQIIIRCIAEDCTLKTPALENDLIGTY